MSATQESDGERHDELHKQGQKDGAAGFGNYEPPHGLLKTVVTLVRSSEDYSRQIEDNQAYRAGWQNGRYG